MLAHFAVLSFTWLATPTGMLITISTDVPAHLQLRSTLLQPWLHVLPRKRRGLWLNDDVRFCFDVYDDLEQQEAGDTTSHTFLVPSWVTDTPLWSYTWGYIEGLVSPSTSAIFKYVSPSAWPPPPAPVRYAFGRVFTASGITVRARYPWADAAIFDNDANITTSTEAYIFTLGNPDHTLTVSLREVDALDKPTGPDLVADTINLQDGVIDGGDGGSFPVYRQTATLPHVMPPFHRYALVTIWGIPRDNVYYRFRDTGWIGAKDAGQTGIVTQWRASGDPPVTWNPTLVIPQCFEMWGTR